MVSIHPPTLRRDSYVDIPAPAPTTDDFGFPRGDFALRPIQGDYRRGEATSFLQGKYLNAEDIPEEYVRHVRGEAVIATRVTSRVLPERAGLFRHI